MSPVFDLLVSTDDKDALAPTGILEKWEYIILAPKNTTNEVIIFYFAVIHWRSY